MGLFDDEPLKKPPEHVVGCDLSSLSVEELDQRISLLRVEIERLNGERLRKAAGRSAAESLFKT